MHGEVVHFEIPVRDNKRAKAFYSGVFGWKTSDTKTPNGGTYMYLVTTKMSEGWEKDPNMRPKSAGAINGGMMKLEEPYTSPILTVQGDSITAALKSIEREGGEAVVKRTTMGRYGAYGYFRDTEGNLMGLFEAPRK